MKKVNPIWGELIPILETMEVPSFRIQKKDHRWLLRNLAIHNSTHKEFLRAMELLKALAKNDLREVVHRGNNLINE
jgi:hypothetical protein